MITNDRNNFYEIVQKNSRNFIFNYLRPQSQIKVIKYQQSFNKIVLKNSKNIIYNFFSTAELSFTANSLYLQTTKRLFTRQIITLDKKK